MYAARGAMRVITSDGVRVVPPDRAVWVPDGLAHRIDLGTGRTALRTLYLTAGLAPLPARCRTILVGPLLRELVLRAVSIAPIRLDGGPDARLVGVLLDQLAVLPHEPPPLPLPTDDRALAVAEKLLGRTVDDSDLDALAASVGSSRRTIERRFAAETGLTVGRWRTRARLLESVRLLSDGQPVGRVAAAVGYATPSAFAAAFRAEFAFPPSGLLSRHLGG